MIELPEALTMARQIRETLTGRRIVRAQAGRSPHGFAWYTGDPASYAAILPGMTITGADIYAGSLRVRLDEQDALLVTMPLRYHAPGKKPPPKHQIFLELDDGGAVTGSVQMWGGVFITRADDPRAGLTEFHTTVVTPTPTDPGFTREHFQGLIEGCAPKESVKELLATHQRVSGVGNGCVQDVFWRARLSPRHKARDLTPEEADRLYRCTVDVIGEMAAQGGRDTEKDLFSHNGGYRTICSSRHLDSPCPSCGGFFRREAYLGGNVIYCPVCQE